MTCIFDYLITLFAKVLLSRLQLQEVVVVDSGLLVLALAHLYQLETVLSLVLHPLFEAVDKICPYVEVSHQTLYLVILLLENELGLRFEAIQVFVDNQW